ncbi:hypothetical protein [uncultured Tateyamaria sp.]|uniref:hypothetical protein n=1 Tax=uncultured Tateyamaria sp. TaxID=455651 RepID=UPI0026234493|nr:hypothetical protein [uncultured Tateyamaria sp.]
MEYGQRQELKSEPASERTTRMMRSVREILEEQGQAHLLDDANFESASEAATMPPRPMPGAATAACAAERGGVQRPPHLRGAMSAPSKPAPAPAAAPAHAQTPTPAATAVPVGAPIAAASEQSRSLLSRLIGR